MRLEHDPRRSPRPRRPPPTDQRGTGALNGAVMSRIEWSKSVTDLAADFAENTSSPNAALAAAIKALSVTGTPGAWHMRHVQEKPGSHGAQRYKVVVLNGSRE